MNYHSEHSSFDPALHYFRTQMVTYVYMLSFSVRKCLVLGQKLNALNGNWHRLERMKQPHSSFTPARRYFRTQMVTYVYMLSFSVRKLHTNIVAGLCKY